MWAAALLSAPLNKFQLKRDESSGKPRPPVGVGPGEVPIWIHRVEHPGWDTIAQARRAEGKERKEGERRTARAGPEGVDCSQLGVCERRGGCYPRKRRQGANPSSFDTSLANKESSSGLLKKRWRVFPGCSGVVFHTCRSGANGFLRCAVQSESEMRHPCKNNTHGLFLLQVRFLK